jgi:succinate dehydrogenase/fumarate reductase-like Fe-S protein
MPDTGRHIRVTVKRGNPTTQSPAPYVTYEVPLVEGWSVSNVLTYINEHLDGGLAHYLSCRRGICGDCVVRVNGEAKFACMEIVTGDLVLEPISPTHLIKDLVCFRKE